MDRHTIAFISCVNDESTYSICVKHLNALIVPPGYAIEIIPVYGAESMTSGYNAGMKRSVSKMKVYLHQDTFIRNPLFIQECIDIFAGNPKIGMIGVAGSQHLPMSGSWWDGEPQFGLIDAYFTSAITLTLGEVLPPYVQVEAIDGVIMVTQYDVEWNERIRGFHFYDASQSIRFRARGYDIVIPAQQQAWVYHHCLDDVNWVQYEACRSEFMQLNAANLV